MSTVIRVFDCETSSPITGASIGNGHCYTNHVNGSYIFNSCDDIAACAGESNVEITSSPASIPASGGGGTFTITYYGKTSQFTATKSIDWSGNVTIPASICPTSTTVSLTAGANTGTTKKQYKLSVSSTTYGIIEQEVPKTTYTFDVYVNDCTNLQGGSFSLTAEDGPEAGPIYSFNGLFSEFGPSESFSIISGTTKVTAHVFFNHIQATARMAIGGSDTGYLSNVNSLTLTDVPLDEIIISPGGLVLEFCNTA